MRLSPNSSAATAIGSTSTNRARHGANDRTSPEMVGPSAGATEMTIEMLPMTCPRRLGGTRFITVVISSGIITAVPEACTIRPISSGRNVGETAQISVPTVKVLIASANTWRVEKRPIR